MTWKICFKLIYSSVYIFTTVDIRTRTRLTDVWVCACLFPLDVRIFCKLYPAFIIKDLTFQSLRSPVSISLKDIWNLKIGGSYLGIESILEFEFPHSFSLNKIFFNELPLAAHFKALNFSLMKTISLCLQLLPL